MFNRLLVAAAATVILSGCTGVGPKSISTSRPAYNIAIQRTNDQELLLNLVRIRYRDTTYFTSVERIAATQEFNQGLSVSGLGTTTDNSFVVPPNTPSVAISNLVTKTLTVNPSFSLNEKPTVFYAPLEGEKFVRQMMTPMNADLLLLLIRSGWSIDRVFSLGLHEINGLKNAPTAAGVTPGREPEFKEFREAVRLMRVLQREQLLDLIRPAGSDAIEMRFTRGASQRDEAKRLKQLLALNPAKDSFRISIASEQANADSIAISTRPLISTLSYLSQGVLIPADDYQSGVAKQTLKADGSPFDWQELLSDVFQIQSSDSEPDDPSTSILYGGKYFFIPKNDLESKATFVLLHQLMSLHSAQAPGGPSISFAFGR